MANARPPDDRRGPPPRPRPFVAEFMLMRPRERFARFDFQDYRCLYNMTPTERRMAVASMTSNEYYAVTERELAEAHHISFHRDNVAAEALLPFHEDAYRDRVVYGLMMNSFEEFTVSGRISQQYAAEVLHNVAEAIRAADRWRGDEDFTDAIYHGTYGEQYSQGRNRNHAQASSQQINVWQDNELHLDMLLQWNRIGAAARRNAGQQGDANDANNL